MTSHFDYRTSNSEWRVISTSYALEIRHFRVGNHGGYLVDSGIFAKCFVSILDQICHTELSKLHKLIYSMQKIQWWLHLSSILTSMWYWWIIKPNIHKCQFVNSFKTENLILYTAFVIRNINEYNSLNVLSVFLSKCANFHSTSSATILLMM